MLQWTSVSKPADIAQVVERRIGNAEVTGPSPVISFKNAWKSKFSSIFYLQLLQLLVYTII